MRWMSLAAVFLLAVAWVRVSASSRSELLQARRAESAGDLEQAIERYQYAMRWYTPGASAPWEAATGLRRIAARARASGRRDQAIEAFERLRGAALSTRSLTSPFASLLPATNRALARLLSLEQRGAGTARGAASADKEAHHRALLERDLAADPWWSLVVIVAFAGWIGGIVALVRRGLDARASVKAAVATRWALWTAALFVLWLWALTQA